MARIVLNPFAKAHLRQHLQIKARALLQTLSLYQSAIGVKKFQSVAQLILNRLHRAQHRVARRDVVRRGVNREARHFLHHFSGQRVKQLDRLDFIVKHAQTNRQIGVLGGENIDRIAAYAKSPTRKIQLIAVVLHRCQLADNLTLRNFVILAHDQNHAVVFLRIADPIDARNGTDNDGIAPLQPTFGRR